MSSHKDRMGEISFWAIPPKGTLAREAVEKRLKTFSGNPEVKKKTKETFQRAAALLAVQRENGLGFPADQMLREYNAEYNGRVFNGTLHDLPGSFNVVEAFNKFLPPSATFELRKEKDHLFSFEGFVDYVTSSSCEGLDANIKELTENGIIYSYNSTSDPLSLEFSTPKGEKFGFSAVSIIRFHDEVSMVLLAGKVCDLQKKTEELRTQFREVRMLSHRSHITPDPKLDICAVPLVEGSNLWKTIVLVRFDLSTKTIDVRYVYQDGGQSYVGHTDDLDSYCGKDGKFFSPELEERYKEVVNTVNEYQALFELCKTCLLLPKYFSQFEDQIQVERHPTRFLEYRKSLKNRKAISLVNSSHCLSYRDAHVLTKHSRRFPESSNFFPPEYRIETSGFWKKLMPHVEGRDKAGRPIHGRTWVSQTQSWVEDDDCSVLVEKRNKRVTTADSGYIYVMRSAAHEKDIFKVGLTRRTTDVRATELSRSTSSPDHFLVVEEWYVADCVLAERLIHEKLKSFRINPNREYFKARYSTIFAAIDEVIAALDGSQTG